MSFHHIFFPLFLKSQKPVSIGCPKGWTHYRRNCYILGPGIASWSSAQHACMLYVISLYMHAFILHMRLPFPLLNSNVMTPTFRLESQLSSIHSKADMKWIWKFAGRQSFWIGKQTRRIFCVVLFCKD